MDDWDDEEELFVFRDSTFAELNYGTLLKYAEASAIQVLTLSSNSVHAVELSIDKGVFLCNYGFRAEHEVILTQENHTVVLACSCGGNGKKLCDHQAIVLYRVMEHGDFRVFYDESDRRKRIADVAFSYGISDEKQWDELFQLSYENRQVKVASKNPELIRLNQEKKDELTKKLAPVAFSPEKLNKHLPNRYISFRALENENHFEFQLHESALTQNGKIKPPIHSLNALELALQETKPEIIQAYTALGMLGAKHHLYRNLANDEETFLKVIKSITIAKPLFEELEVVEVWDTKPPKDIDFALRIHEKPMLLHLDVKQNQEFYEITGFIEVDNHKIDFDQVKMKSELFIRRGQDLYLIKNWNYLRTLSYFRKNHHKLIIHQSQFDEFHIRFLVPLENVVNINYSYVKKATRAIIKQTQLATIQAKRIYLTDSENYIHITPIIEYGKVEIPILSKRKLLTIDQTGNSFEIPRNEDLEVNFLGQIIRLHKDFEYQLGGDFFYLHKNQFLENDWFLNAFESWSEAELEIHGFQELTKLKLVPKSMKVSVQIISGIDWFETKAHIKVGDNRVRLKEIQRSIIQKSRYVKLGDGQMALLPQQWLERFSAFFREGELFDDVIRIPKTSYQFIDEWFEAEEIDSTVREQITEIKEKITHFERIPEIDLPLKFETELRHYQREGYHWLHFLNDFGFGGILADDMGLGKTIQLLAYLSKKQEVEKGTHLIIVPTSLVFNWKDETAKFTPHLRILDLHGSKRVKATHHFEAYDIVLSTYGTLLSDIRYLKDFVFDTIILDEGQAIKNPDSKRYKTVRLLQSKQRFVLTGTPIENNTLDIFSILSFCNPGMFGSVKQFKDHFAMPIDKFQDSQRAKELQKRIHPFLLRRTKKQVATELPEKTEMIVYCEMDHEQQRVYDVYKTELKEYLMSEPDFTDGQSSMHVLAGLTKLRQICNSPALINENGVSYGEQSAKIQELMEQIEDKKKHHKILVFSQFVGMLKLVERALEERSIPYSLLTGQTKKRKEVVNAFQENEHIRVFLISLKAGGMGLNLTQADYVYLLDPWWNPAVENQAIDRAYRIGQDKKVVAVRFITPNTIEEKILELQKRKQELVGDLVHTDVSTLKQLSRKELVDLL
ncbi:SNF2-related protein [Fluviicola taffensis DSM 16823]|uniref:SNF2-related protein n=2 Tax=Fluviicola TaxID=332102 RepID=F2IGN8_FLUTR|nr:SNF2-related protein [Fluviicola taffensis DSM 16823]